MGTALLGAAAPKSSSQTVLAVKPIIAPTTAKAIADSANAFAQALRPDLRAKLRFGFNDPERHDWHNLPNSRHPRKGVRMGEMSDAERGAAHVLMQTMLSGQGYLKVAGIMQHDELFNDRAIAGGPAEQTNAPIPAEVLEKAARGFTPEEMRAAAKLGNHGGNFGAALFFIDLFGDVGSPNPWGIQLDGHHLGVNLTVIDNREVTLMPTFLGSEPALIQTGPFGGSELFGRETRFALELLNSLSPEQRNKAVLGNEVPSDIFTGAERGEQLKTFQGIAGLQDHQRELAEWIIEEYVGTAPPEIAKGYRDAIRSAGFDNLHFAWIGPADLTKEVYFRLHSSAILIELQKHESLQRSSGPANHIHSIMRTPANDYGIDWMRQHHLEYDHTYHY